MAVDIPVVDPPSSASLAAARLPSSHRLPTVSASEALRNLSGQEHGLTNVLTNIKSVDESLGDGFESGKVTELWGPIGAGKTAIALAAAQHVLRKGGSVIWIDTTTMLSIRRLQSMNLESALSRFHHTTMPSLTHLLALLLHPPATFEPDKANLLVLTSLHSCLEASCPRHTSFPPGIKTDTQKWAAGRRYAILGSIVLALNKLAALYGIAVTVTTGCATRSRSGFSPPGPLGLVPGVGGSEWDAGIWTRIAVLRDFNGRFVGVQKFRGGNVPFDQGPVGKVAAFDISEQGLAIGLFTNGADAEAKEDAGMPRRQAITVSPVRSRKRTFDEVADSDDEEEGDEYGSWAETEEDALAIMEVPP